MHHFANSHLVVCGSSSSGLCLKSAGDIDLDLIIPHSYYSKEALDSKLGHDEHGRVTDITAMSDFCLDLYKSIEEKKNVTIEGIDLELDNSDVEIESKEIPMTGQVYDKAVSGSIEAEFYPVTLELQGKKANVTRSLPLRVVVHGFPMEVDLFPKFIDEKGMICGLGPAQSSEDSKTSREWQVKSPLRKNKEGMKFSDNDRAAALFLKFWRLGLPGELKKGLKGYHISRTLEKLVVRRCSELSGPFDAGAVYARMHQIIAGLKDAYSNLEQPSELLQDTPAGEAREQFSLTIREVLQRLANEIPRPPTQQNPQLAAAIREAQASSESIPQIPPPTQQSAQLAAAICGVQTSSKSIQPLLSPKMACLLVGLAACLYVAVRRLSGMK